ncbi:hypothetical protein EH165_10150 [Nakamurella antarctica]|uniref:Uncharacterized protein n=1 Tax=Nakamurella antarctica TaxID=1902245 RepID=A0A3G8ZWP8_9ACTN|nr:hypothetical protein [Nakamurella antarctica]AZI58446.1 hypothetical protein EH165_10150 [Nakamurella antarctica]
MPPRSRIAFAPLDLDAARRALADGKNVRVGIVPMGLFPSGGSGRLRAIGDPATEGEEFLHVEVTLAGSKDVIPFAPGDLTPIKRGQAEPEPVRSAKPATPVRAARTAIAPRAASALRSVSAVAAPPTLAAVPALPLMPIVPAQPLSGSTSRPSLNAVPDQKLATPARLHAAGALTATSDPAAPKSAAPHSTAPKSAAPHSTAPKSAAPKSVSPTTGVAAATEVATGSPGTEPRSNQPAKKNSRGKRLPVIITLSTTGVENTAWQIEARQGTKIVVRAATVAPTRAAELVATLNNESLTDYVAGVLAEHRKHVQERADHLAAALAIAQAELDQYPQS